MVESLEWSWLWLSDKTIGPWTMHQDCHYSTQQFMMLPSHFSGPPSRVQLHWCDGDTMLPKDSREPTQARIRHTTKHAVRRRV